MQRLRMELISLGVAFIVTGEVSVKKSQWGDGLIFATNMAVKQITILSLNLTLCYFFLKKI